MAIVVIDNPPGLKWLDSKRTTVGLRTNIESNPPRGMYRVTNLYIDPSTGKLTIEYDDGT